MGIHDREYYRDESTPRGIQLGGDMTLVTKLIIVNVAIFIANFFTPVEAVLERIPAPQGGGFVERWVRLSDIDDPAKRDRLANDRSLEKTFWLQAVMSTHADTLVQPWMWWQFVTYGFAHGTVNHLLFNMLGLFFLGRHVEMLYGRKEFLCVYMASLIAGSVIWSARSYFDGFAGGGGLLGASGAVTAIIMLFIFNFPHEKLLMMMVIPMPAWLVGVLIIVMNVIGVGGEHIAYDVHLVGAAFAACYFYFGWNFSRILPGGGGFARSGARLFRPQPRLKVHQPQTDYRELDQQADRILAKLHSEGEASLTDRERQILEDYSRRMKQKHR